MNLLGPTGRSRGNDQSFIFLAADTTEEDLQDVPVQIIPPNQLLGKVLDNFDEQDMETILREEETLVPSIIVAIVTTSSKSVMTTSILEVAHQIGSMGNLSGIPQMSARENEADARQD
eukprot:Gb_38357 [translate_table: standard]